MKKLLVLVFFVSQVLCGFAEVIPADSILKYVRTKLPDTPLQLTGSLIAKAKNGFKKSYPVRMDLDWGADEPTAIYTIEKESLTITWNADLPTYTFSNKKNKPTSEIMGTGITWADLSFSVLWWPNSKLVDEGKKLNRACFIVEVPVPDSDQTMRLWIEKKMGMLMEAHTLNHKGKKQRRLKIKSIKKMDGMWVAKDLELTNYESGNKTTLQISDLKWKKPKETNPSAVAFDPSESINQLGLDLYAKLADEHQGNLFFSPYSISSALAMTYGGARGETAKEMSKALHFGGQGATHPAFSYLRKKFGDIQNKSHVQLAVANSLWPEKSYTFKPDYLAMTQEFYGAEIEAVNFKFEPEMARLHINSWVENQTASLIKDLLPKGSVDAMTRLVLANAIYFKGDWAKQFDPQATAERLFTLTSGHEIPVPMMSKTSRFGYAEANEFKALELPYKGDDLSMLVLLPNQTNHFPSLNNEILSSLEFKTNEVIVQLPKFKIETTFSLTETLAALGMPLAFSDQADFSGMDEIQALNISSVIHKAFIDVDETGTEAAAATAVTIRAASLGKPSPQFIANRPFLFLIRENSTGTILFMGRVMNPAK